MIFPTQQLIISHDTLHFIVSAMYVLLTLHLFKFAIFLKFFYSFENFTFIANFVLQKQSEKRSYVLLKLFIYLEI